MDTLTTFPALFLDRDGVINVDHGYVGSRDRWEFMPGIFDLCRAASDRGMKIIVVTNQAGIARGFYTEKDFLSLTSWMTEQFLARGIEIQAVYYCPTHPTAGRGEYRRDSEDRKPGPGMLLRAAREHGIDLSRSVILGDKLSDVQAGRAAAVGTCILLADDEEDPLRLADFRVRHVDQAIIYLP